MTPETTQTPENNLRAELDRLTYAAFLLTLDHGKVLSAVLKAIDGSLEETTANSDLVERAVELALKEVRCESGTNWDGVYGTAMPAWRQLPKEDLSDVAAYVRLLQSNEVIVSASDRERKEAQQIYEGHCVSCHGASGRGDGPTAGALKHSPVNFQVRQPSAERAFAVIHDGIPGSSMPAWKTVLTDDQFVRLMPKALGL